MIIIAGKSSLKLVKMWSLEKIASQISKIWIFKNRNFVWKPLLVGKSWLPAQISKGFNIKCRFLKIHIFVICGAIFSKLPIFTHFNVLFPAMIIIFLSYISYKFWNYVINPHWMTRTFHPEHYFIWPNTKFKFFLMQLLLHAKHWAENLPFY